MLKAMWVEIKNAIFTSSFHVIRFLGLLIIPFIYGFAYIYAFYDPFESTDKLKVNLVTHKNDAFADVMAKELSKEKRLEIGDVTMTLKLKHIYVDQNTSPKEVKKEIATKAYATIELPRNFGKNVAGVTFDVLAIIDVIKNPKEAMKAFKDLLAKLEKSKGLINFYDNYKKNYLIGFGMNIGTATSGMYKAAIKSIIDSKPEALWGMIEKLSKYNKLSLKSKLRFKERYYSLSKFAKNIHINDFNVIKIKSQMGGEKTKYGYGLAPFFICVAMWVGGMVMTFAIHRKRYDKSISAYKTYFGKYALIAISNIIQASILFVALYLIGFKYLGIYHWLSMYLFAIIMGLIFSAIIQAIRFAIPSRNIGLFAIIFLLVIQMCAGGGLFPVLTQNNIFQTIHWLTPFRLGINAIRELSFQTNWAIVINSLFSLMAIGFLFLTIGLFYYKRRLKGKGTITKWLGNIDHTHQHSLKDFFKFHKGGKDD